MSICFCIIFIVNIMNKNQITVVVTEDLDQRISKAAAYKGLSKASWVRQLIIEKLEQKDRLNA